ncbi:hypothetical protein CDAR_467631 [Caerostris darwini]|uniref:Uncharacterized protein n=1 Tax=Caerostris darwini TaxID=1538125 RepID=A0AAV4SM10_9ARAC|nr:hypothetical protein CDAR_467631 [Caerostris darwini]
MQTQISSKISLGEKAEVSLKGRNPSLIHEERSKESGWLDYSCYHRANTVPMETRISSKTVLREKAEVSLKGRNPSLIHGEHSKGSGWWVRALSLRGPRVFQYQLLTFSMSEHASSQFHLHPSFTFWTTRYHRKA